MARRLANITLDNLDDLPRRCRRCVFWELDPVGRTRADETGESEFEKEAWVSATLLEWGSCGKVVYVDGVAAGYALFAPPAYVPRSIAFPTSPVSGDAVLLMTAHILPEFASIGLGRVLVQTIAKDLLRRGVRAIEAFGDKAWTEPGSCVLPADYLLANAPRAEDDGLVARGRRGRAGAVARVDDSRGRAPPGVTRRSRASVRPSGAQGARAAPPRGARRPAGRVAARR
jgi:GNAT superfamily N-acetyltransferase